LRLVPANALSDSTSDLRGSEISGTCAGQMDVSIMAVRTIIALLFIDPPLLVYYHKKLLDKKQQGPRKIPEALLKNHVGTRSHADADDY
jgi:hypothetical protein